MSKPTPAPDVVTVAEFRPVPGYAGYSVGDDGQMRGPRSALRPMAMPSGHQYPA